jgi:aldehyde:ferredoxin oxidoreductase
MRYGGWTGRLLRVNLNNKTIVKEDIPEKLLTTYIGSRGLAVKYLYDEVDPKVDPFSPDNKVILATGPLTGTFAPASARYAVITKSPLTNTITSSNAGGYWGAELKMAGYDMIIIEGKAQKPVYLLIWDEEVEIKSATHLWGRTTSHTDEIIKIETGVSDAKTLCIGPAGERLSRIACVINEKFRAAGRTGVGAVLGSKNLKAVAVKGTGEVAIFDPILFMEKSIEAREKLSKNPVTAEALPKYGTNLIMNVINKAGGLPAKNSRFAQFDFANNIGGEAVSEKYLVSGKSCFCCPIACGRVSKIQNHIAEGPEYESAWALGAQCGVSDLQAIIRANWLCNDLGLDTISTGVTIACAMELFEKGYITQEDTKMPLNFGDAKALLWAVEKMGYREGFGDILAEGSLRLSQKYGHPELSMSTKGQEFPAYDPRAFQGIGLSYATSNRGACHLRAYTISHECFGEEPKMDPASIEGKAELVIRLQNANAAMDSTGLCVFITNAVDPEDIIALLNYATGMNYDRQRAMKIGERIWNLERLFNIKAGIMPDELPKRVLEEPIPSGPAKDRVSLLKKMLDEYYRQRGWDKDGIPTVTKLSELGIL